MLERYNVEYTDDSSLGDVETELWGAMFSPPNDRFDDDQYAHSPWFDRYFREEHTVKSLKMRGDWDEIWIKVMPVKSINYPYILENEQLQVTDSDPLPMPSQIQISHFDHNTLSLKLLTEPLSQSGFEDAASEEVAHIDPEELKVMLLLRV
jgi:hypothetical protein